MQIDLSSLDDQLLALITEIGAIARDKNRDAYLVGGLVRDLLLDVPITDIDIMISHEALLFVKEIHAESLLCKWGETRKPTLFKKFMTAKLRFKSAASGGISEIDFATCRKEHYKAVASPPMCKPGSLSEDLARRDFSINAMALKIAPEEFGSLIDMHNGVNDLSLRRIRILHPDSFRDDPARIIRALKFMRRFRLELEPHTKEMLSQSLREEHLGLLSTKRAYSELNKVLKEKDWKDVLLALRSAGALEQIAKELHLESVDDIKTAILEGPK